MLSKTKFFFMSVAVPLAFSQLAIASPSISSVLRDESTPGKLIINGSGFTDKEKPGPVFFFDFENNLLTQSSLSTIKDIKEVNGTLTTETSPTGEGSVLKYRVVNDYRSKAIPGLEITPAPDRLYVYFHRKYDFSISDSSNWGPNGLNLKVNRFWGEDGNNIYIGYQGKEGNNSGRIFPEYTATGGATWVGSELAQLKDKWSQEEIIYQASDLDKKNGLFDVYRDGNVVSSNTYRMRTNSRSSKYNEIWFDQISNGVNESQNLNIFYDNIYIDTSFHRVFISPSSTFNDAKSKIIQVPTYWTDNTIEVVFNAAGIPESEAYIYVVDSEGRANSAGIKICDKDCISRPKPPTSLQVN
ncbi:MULTISPECIES: hypothetical protein [Marinobacter]|jgi:hypothetical protein|uniref:hypothetical protein n=1 Tax=Marinobacter TaxID=2742 RepID=UPI001FFF5C66|nr:MULTISPECIES: hypothetical protein [Marinobacter]MCK2147771.1 hypothetical protein [Marinobacter alexandrii]